MRRLIHIPLLRAVALVWVLGLVQALVQVLVQAQGQAQGQEFL
jgi:hypothetical protein